MTKYTTLRKPEVSRLVDISIILPVFNEANNLTLLFEEIVDVMSSYAKTFEILAINDGSTDDSLTILRELADLYSEIDITIISFTRNFGQAAALYCGFRHARSNLIVPLDADLQNDPGDIPRLVEELEKGYDVVSGWRRQRKDSMARMIASAIANRMINKLIKSTGVRIHDYGCTLKVYRRNIVKNIRLYGEMHRFIPAFAGWLGARVTEIEVNHRPRINGKSKYGMKRIAKVILDLIAVRFFADSFTKPMQFFGKYAIYLLAVMFLAVSGLWISDALNVISGVSMTTYVVVLGFFLVAVLNMLLVGLLAEILIKNYFESADHYPYVIQEIVRTHQEKTRDITESEREQSHQGDKP